MNKRLLKGVVTVSLLAALPINTAMAAELSTPSVDAQQTAAKVVRVSAMPRVMMEYHFDDYAVYYTNKNDVTSTYYYVGDIGGATFSGTLDLFSIAQFEHGGYVGHYRGTVFGKS